MDVVLNAQEIAVLMKQAPNSAKNGGWQGLLVKMQKNVDKETGRLALSDKDIARIKTYANYDRGTWENMLKAAFERTLGSLKE